MAIDLANYEEKAREAVQAFWGNREKARQKQIESRRAVTDRSPHFPVSKEFQGASYLDRYNILCQRLMQEQLYSAASIIASRRTAVNDGAYAEMSGMTGLRTFVAELAGHVASEAARSL